MVCGRVRAWKLVAGKKSAFGCYLWEQAGTRTFELLDEV